MTATRFTPSRSSTSLWSMSQSASDKQLVVLIENGGIDLGIPALVDRIIRSIPQGERLVPDDLRARFVQVITDGLKSATDTLIESADLALNEFGAARPTYYGEVNVLRDSTATFAELKTTLFGATKAGRLVDLLILTHGNDGIYVDSAGVVGAKQISALSTEFGGPLSIRSVYMMNCVGSSLNGPWLDAGARTSVGSHRFNYLPEPTLHYFWTKWKSGQAFEAAATGAYRDTITTIDAIIKSYIAALPLPLSLLASQVDAASWDFVGRPTGVAGTGSLTISSDRLPPATSAQQSTLITTVLPAHASQLTQTSRASDARLGVACWSGVHYQMGAAAPSPGRRRRRRTRRRIASAEDFLTLKVPHPLTQSQVDALVSFACGIGAAAFTRSKALALLEGGRFLSRPGRDRAVDPCALGRRNTRQCSPHGAAPCRGALLSGASDSLCRLPGRCGSSLPAESARRSHRRRGDPIGLGRFGRPSGPELDSLRLAQRQLGGPEPPSAPGGEAQDAGRRCPHA